MKKNINVNIFDNLYPMDEDAYELLLQYLENMRRYYSNREDGEEISDDVEHRVAELLTELMGQGVQAITIEHVSDIIRRIGDPQDFDNVDDSDQETTSAGKQSAEMNENTGEENGRTSRRLFRDPNDKLLGGVVSGICHYLGITDTLIPRLLVVILLFASFSTLAILYCVLWVLIPEATTPEDRLRMYGKPVTAKGISEELMKGVNSAKTFVQSPNNQDRARGCLSALLKLLLGIMAALALLLLLALFLALIFGVGSFVLAVGPFGESDFSNMVYHLPTWMMWSLFLSVFLLLAIPFFSIIRWFSRKPNPSGDNSSTKVVLVAVWLLALLWLVYTGISIKKTVEKNYIENPKEFLAEESASMLKKFKMNIRTLSGSRNRIHVWTVTPDSEDENNREKALQIELDPNSDKPFLFDIYREETLSPGRYRIEGFVHSNGTGAVIYALQGDSTNVPTVYEIPAYSKSNILAMTPDSIYHLPYFSEAPGDTLLALRFRTLADDFEWDYACLDVEVKEKGNLVFGYSNASQYSSEVNDVTHFEASKLNIRRLN